MIQPRKETLAEFFSYYLGVLPTWARMTAHNSAGIFGVIRIIRLKPMGPGMIPLDHPWITGRQPATGTAIWPDNIIFRTPRTEVSPADSDGTIVTKVGNFLAAMVRKSVPDPEIPWGPKRRMPHGINYLHGAIHYNAGLLIFENFAEAILHFTDKRFRDEIRRFARTEKREILLIFRDRDYDCVEFGYLAGFLRSVLPWFSNSNGPKRRVMWGNPSPYAVVNIITGNWKFDTYKVYDPAKLGEIVRPPVTPGQWFQTPDYCGTRNTARWPEKMLAILTERRVKLRGGRANLFFVDRRKLLRKYTAEDRAAETGP
ncbi:MAG: hypothetical protein V4726_22545 [Verrucomicrobiota bacterium]